MEMNKKLKNKLIKKLKRKGFIFIGENVIVDESRGTVFISKIVRHDEIALKTFNYKEVEDFYFYSNLRRFFSEDVMLSFGDFCFSFWACAKYVFYNPKEKVLVCIGTGDL
jgi:hypothetical protein